MKIQQLRIENILGIKHLELTPGGTLTEISGENGLGKTSVLEAIKAATQGGHDATLLRKGADKGEIVLVMDNGVELRKTVTEKRSTLDLVKDGQKITKAADTIKGLTDILSVNPVDFLTAPKKERVRVLLEAMPIHADPERLTQITGIPVTTEGHYHGLALIDMLHKQIYDDRTGTNRAIKEKEGTINQMELAMPDAPGGIEGDEDDIRAKLDQHKAGYLAELQRIEGKLTGIRNASAERKAALRADAQAKIDAIKAELETAIEKETAELAKIEGMAQRQRDKTTEDHRAATEPLVQAISAIAANRDAAAKRKVAIENIERMREDLEGLSDDANRQTQALQGLEKYKSELLDSLPIPGLEVRDGEVLRDGIPFDRLNTAQQVEIAIEIAKLRAGDLAICCVDRFECLSPTTLEAFIERAKQSNLQLFVTRVEAGDMTIRTV